MISEGIAMAPMQTRHSILLVGVDKFVVERNGDRYDGSRLLNIARKTLRRLTEVLRTRDSASVVAWGWHVHHKSFHTLILSLSC